MVRVASKPDQTPKPEEYEMFKTPISPTPTADGAFSPSWLALRVATASKTDFEPINYPDAYAGPDLKILMICTEERNMTMANGRRFSTGNHPVEMMLPMMHLTNAGFDIDIVTPTGASVKIEMWAMPQEDEAVMAYYASFKDKFDNPGSAADFVKDSMNDTSPYVAVYLPGGHGAMLGLPENEDVGQIIHWCHHRNLHMLALCHGPAALLAATLPGNRTESSTAENSEFIYSGYKMAAFPDKVDAQTPLIGYMPGHMPWRFGERLEALGVEFINTKADDSCHIDRKLITGASPKAANQFGKIAARALLDQVARS